VKVINDTPFVVATSHWEDLEGHPKLTVSVKCTFKFEGHVSASMAAIQLPVLFADVLNGKGSSSSVRFESDMAPFKPKADVVVVGKAYCPGGNPVTKLDVSLSVGGLQKSIRVFGDRQWWFPTWLVLFPIKTPPKRFTTMDLVYERAFGGVYDGPGFYCKENLVGTGYIRRRRVKSTHKKKLPNLEDPKHLIRWWWDKPKPVGFGFYGRGWHPRVKYAGTYDEKYQKERAPKPALDFSYAFYNGAYPDLQVEGYLRGDEEVELINLSPEPRLHFHLPGIRPQITISKWTVPPDKWMEQNATADRELTINDVPTQEESVIPVLDTLVFIPDEGIFYEVFRGVCSLNSLTEPEVATVKITM
jgi:hypothetical protein